jgi:XTP/dITP diphosphohydrolase
MTSEATPRVTLLATSARVAPGLLTAEAWDLVRRVPVRCADPAHPQLPALREAGADVEVLPGPTDPAEAGPCQLSALWAAAASAATAEVVWLLEPAAGWPGPSAAVDAHLLAHAVSDPDGVRVLPATQEVTGAALLDAVAVLDRLRSPGGCPWDGEQTHASLAPFLLEEAYEAYQALEDEDPLGLREELGDVLMQVLFHARIAQEGAGASRFDIDQVASLLVDKLVRRHPHVFGDVVVGGADDVVTNWEAIKVVEKGRRSVTEGVPLSQPALSLAAKLQKRARRAGVPADLVVSAGSSPTLTASADGAALDEAALGDLLFVVVARAAAAGVDPEVALRGRARVFRDTLAAAEEAAHAAGVEPSAQDADAWRSRWPRG